MSCKPCTCLHIDVPDSKFRIYPGCRVRLGRFDRVVWRALHGWYEWGGNRPVCGWYLQNIDEPTKIKPLHLSDLDDIYLIEEC